jgi:tRNA-dihydrouridine synthase B
LRNSVLLAPMSGVTDLPFRQLAYRLGAGLVVTEMVASEDLVKGRPDVMRRAEGHDLSPYVVQLSGREARWMAQGAQMAADHGADIIDINMGCPAKQVTRGQSGSALMRDLDHAVELIEATVDAVFVPVTLKMRMGWDHESLNAPELAVRAERAGVQMITVHGRTRCQFFKGEADWEFIARVKAAVSVPVIANGDLNDLSDLPGMLRASNADGAMIGRGAYGRPWFPGQAASFLSTGQHPDEPPLADQREIALEHYELMLGHYGTELGIRTSRKHLGWYVAGTIDCPSQQRYWRKQLCQQSDPNRVREDLGNMFEQQMEKAA